MTEDVEFLRISADILDGNGFFFNDHKAANRTRAIADKLERLEKLEGETERLRKRLRNAAREEREAMRDAAAEASRAERYPDEPYGMY